MPVRPQVRVPQQVPPRSGFVDLSCADGWFLSSFPLTRGLGNTASRMSEREGPGRRALAAGAQQRGRRGAPIRDRQLERPVGREPEARRKSVSRRQGSGHGEKGSRSEQSDQGERNLEGEPDKERRRKNGARLESVGVDQKLGVLLKREPDRRGETEDPGRRRVAAPGAAEHAAREANDDERGQQ